MIKEGTRVIVNDITGEFHGVVESIRYTTLLEFNIQEPINPDKSGGIPNDVNTARPVTVYNVLVDGDSEPKEFYQFIREE
jgi:hypothetical protein